MSCHVIKASVCILKQWDILDCIEIYYFSFNSVLCLLAILPCVVDELQTVEKSND